VEEAAMGEAGLYVEISCSVSANEHSLIKVCPQIQTTIRTKRHF